jgi:hypothetical protein
LYALASRLTVEYLICLRFVGTTTTVKLQCHNSLALEKSPRMSRCIQVTPNDLFVLRIEA